MKSLVKSLFRTSMIVFYALGRYAWANYLKYVDRFTENNTMYTKEYGEAALKDLEAAAAMPNVDVRRADTTTLNKGLKAAAKKCTKRFKSLKRIIKNSFDKGELKEKFTAAGGSYYVDATKNDWNAVTEMMSMASAFINANIDVLTKKGGMPLSFVDSLLADRQAFADTLETFKEDETESSSATSAKIKATNAVYLTLMNMLGEAKDNFEDEPEMVKLFTYIELVKTFSYGRKNGIRFELEDSATKEPLKGAVITLQPGNIVNTITSKTGALSIKLPMNKYSYTITLVGYVPIQGTIVADSDVMQREKLTLSKQEATAQAS